MYIEVILGCMVGIQVLTLGLMLFLASRGTGLLMQLFTQLDSKIAQAITKVMSEGGIDLEPVNPLQAMLAQIIQQKMGDAMPRDDGGQFTVITPSESPAIKN